MPDGQKGWMLISESFGRETADQRGSLAHAGHITHGICNEIISYIKIREKVDSIVIYENTK
jgi:hypothetical protein